MENKKLKNKVSVGFVALGCPKNIVDSEKMLAKIALAGFAITADPDNADVVIINTCGFIAPAKQEAIEAIKHAVRQKKKGRIKKIIVAGCLSQRMGGTLIDEIPQIDSIVALANRDQIAEIIKKTLSSTKSESFLSADTRFIHDDTSRILTTPAHWAYLRISEGCSRGCSFCTIPAIRGKFRSKPPQLVLKEAKELVKNGAVELSIIAQDTTAYGRDIKIKNGLAKLLAELEKIPKLKWIRLMYLYPASIDESFIGVIATSKKILHYIDMPVQHINNDILRAMRRSDTKERTCRLIEKLRAAIPDVVLRTTVMVGFPGETEQRFDELLEFVKWAKFDALGCFTFYPELETPAAKLTGQIEKSVKNDRAKKIMLAQQKIAFEKNKGRIGSKLLCLVDSIDRNGIATARFYGQAPHIDSVCLIKNCGGESGRFVKAEVVGVKQYDLIAEQI